MEAFKFISKNAGTDKQKGKKIILCIILFNKKICG